MVLAPFFGSQCMDHNGFHCFACLDALYLMCERDYNEAERRQDAQPPPSGADDEAEKEPLPRRQIVAGGGSLAATGLQMSQKQNRGAAVVVEPELDLVFAGQ